jgi:hypothetical protein
MGAYSMTKMEQYILDNWKEYERTCKAECKKVAQRTGHKRNSWTHERNVYYGVETQADKERKYGVKSPSQQKIEDRCLRIVELHKRGITWNKIAQNMGTRIQNVARVLRDRGYEPNV